jgi:hypothetical protein
VGVALFSAEGRNAVSAFAALAANTVRDTIGAFFTAFTAILYSIGPAIKAFLTIKAGFCTVGASPAILAGSLRGFQAHRTFGTVVFLIIAGFSAHAAVFAVILHHILAHAAVFAVVLRPAGAAFDFAAAAAAVVA